ncbi:MAG: hypothetical protein V3T99_02175 [Nitrososphaerales archaeon]
MPDQTVQQQVTALRDEYETKYDALEKQYQDRERRYQDRGTQLSPELAKMFAAKTPSRGLPFLGRVDPIERSYGPEMTERGASMPNQ